MESPRWRALTQHPLHSCPLVLTVSTKCALFGNRVWKLVGPQTAPSVSDNLFITGRARSGWCHTIRMTECPPTDLVGYPWGRSGWCHTIRMTECPPTDLVGYPWGRSGWCHTIRMTECPPTDLVGYPWGRSGWCHTIRMTECPPTDLVGNPWGRYIPFLFSIPLKSLYNKYPCYCQRVH